MYVEKETHNDVLFKKKIFGILQIVFYSNALLY
jgi:hypothetical protein